MTRPWVWAAGLLALTVAGCGRSQPPAADASGAPAGGAAPSVTVAAVHYGSIAQTVHVTGTLVPPREQQATIGPPVSGVLSNLYVRLGQHVARGQAVAQLNTQTVEGQIQQAQATMAQNQVQVHQAEANALQQQAQAESAVMQAEAAVTTAQANATGARATLRANQSSLDNARRTYARLKSLLADGLVATKDVEAARVAVLQAQAQVQSQAETVHASEQALASQRQALKAAQAGRLTTLVKREDVRIAQDQVRNAQGALMTAQGLRSQYTLRSPIDGQVIAVGASSGETVDATTRVAVIANLTVMEMQLAVPARELALVHVGQVVEARVTGVANRLVRGRLDLVQTQVDPNSDTVTARSRVPNPDLKLANGAFLQADIIVGRHDHVLVVPKAALLDEQDGKATVVVVDQASVAHVTPVRVGLETDTQAEVSGVSEGARVAVVGGYGLADGATVQVTH